VCNIAFLLDPKRAIHRTQEEVGLRDPSLELAARMLSDVKFPILGQRESVIEDHRMSLEDQVFSMSEDPWSSWVRRNGFLDPSGSKISQWMRTHCLF
jgi:hypothetical protein